MKAVNTDRPSLWLVATRRRINADFVAFTVMDQIDATYPAQWQALPMTVRRIIRSMIVHAVAAEDAKR